MEFSLPDLLRLKQVFDFLGIFIPFFVPLDLFSILGHFHLEAFDIPNKIVEGKIKDVFGVNAHQTAS